MQPFFSIIMPTYNRASFLKKSIRSVIDQSYTDWELLIIDDGSTDESADVIAAFDDERIRYHYQKNKGKSAARNWGITLSKGKYIAFLDSDDEFKKDHLKIHKQHIETNGKPVGLFYTQGYIQHEGEINEDPHPIRLKDLSFQICPMTLAISVHRDIVHHEKFEESLIVREDAELWDRIRRKGYPFIRIDDYTVVANYHDDNSRKDLFAYYCNLEYAIKYYIKDRFAFSSEEYHDLVEVYKKLAFFYWERSEIKSSFFYLMKEIIAYPVCIFERSFWGLIKRNLQSLFRRGGLEY